MILNDDTARRQAEATHALLAAIVKSSRDAIFMRTMDGIVRTWNLGAESLFGYTPEEMIGQTMDVVTPVGERDKWHLVLDLVKGGEQVQNYDVVRIRKDGTTADLSFTLSPIVSERASSLLPRA